MTINGLIDKLQMLVRRHGFRGEAAVAFESGLKQIKGGMVTRYGGTDLVVLSPAPATFIRVGGF